MGKYIVLSGDSYEVQADSAEQALSNFHVFYNGGDCSCGLPQFTDRPGYSGDFCECVQEGETLTQVIDTEHGSAVGDDVLTALKTWAEDPAVGVLERTKRWVGYAIAYEIINGDPVAED